MEAIGGLRDSSRQDAAPTGLLFVIRKQGRVGLLSAVFLVDRADPAVSGTGTEARPTDKL